MNKLFLIKEKQTVVRVYDLNQGKTAEFHRINGTWFLIGEFSNKPFTQKAFYRFLFHCQHFSPKGKKYSIALDRSQALPLVRMGYQLIDEHLNAYHYVEGKYFKNREELCDLPSYLSYIVMPFQQRIRDNEAVITVNARYVRSKEYTPERKPNRPLQDSSELEVVKFKIEKEVAEEKVEKLQIQLDKETKEKVRYSIFSSIAGFASGFICRHVMKKLFPKYLYLLES